MKLAQDCVCIRDGRFHHLLSLLDNLLGSWTAVGISYNTNITVTF